MERERDGVVGLGGEEMYMFGNEKKKKEFISSKSNQISRLYKTPPSPPLSPRLLSSLLQLLEISRLDRFLRKGGYLNCASA